MTASKAARNLVNQMSEPGPDLDALTLATRVLLVCLASLLALYLAYYLLAEYLLGVLPAQLDTGISLLGAFAAYKAQRAQLRPWTYGAGAAFAVLLPISTSAALALLAAEAAQALKLAGRPVNKLFWPSRHAA